MLLPPLRERMELLHSLLPQGPDRWESLSKGQVRGPERLWAAAEDLMLSVLLNCKFLEQLKRVDEICLSEKLTKFCAAGQCEG